MRAPQVVLAASALGLVACGAAAPDASLSPSTAPQSAIIGTLSMVGGLSPGLREFVTGTIRITNTTTNAVTTVATNAYGQFIAPVPPGTYRVNGTSPNYGGGAPGYDCQALFLDPETRKYVQTVTVRAMEHWHDVVAADVYCQMS